MPSDDKKKIRARLRSYERNLRKEKEEHGSCRDGAGKRYHIGPYYMLLGDNDGAVAAFLWFEEEFPDDVGEPGNYLCWSLALYRSHNEIGAANKLRRTMLANLYLLPHLLGSPIEEIAMWHGSSDAWPSYVHYVPEPYLELWTDAERQWASRLYHSEGFQAVRARYIEIGKLLETTSPGPARSRLVAEMCELEG